MFIAVCCSGEKAQTPESERIGVDFQQYYQPGCTVEVTLTFEVCLPQKLRTLELDLCVSSQADGARDSVCTAPSSAPHVPRAVVRDGSSALFLSVSLLDGDTIIRSCKLQSTQSWQYTSHSRYSEKMPHRENAKQTGGLPGYADDISTLWDLL